MDNTWSHISLAPLHFRITSDKSINERIIIMTGSGMHNHARSLIDNQNIIILINNLQRQILWNDVALGCLCTCRRYSHHIMEAQRITRLTRFLVDKHVTVPNQLLYTGTRNTRQNRCQEAIEAQSYLLILYCPALFFSIYICILITWAIPIIHYFQS